mgnify:CR=1 FL=1
MKLHRNPDGEDKKIAIYHVVYENETFEDAASMLFGLISEAQKINPGKDRILYLDIDGHRNEKGGFDRDMLELQMEYMLGFLLKYLKEVVMPLARVKNKNKQNNDIPDKFFILSNDEDKEKFLKEMEGKTIFYEEN